METACFGASLTVKSFLSPSNVWLHVTPAVFLAYSFSEPQPATAKAPHTKAINTKPLDCFQLLNIIFPFLLRLVI